MMHLFFISGLGVFFLLALPIHTLAAPPEAARQANTDTLDEKPVIKKPSGKKASRSGAKSSSRPANPGPGSTAGEDVLKTPIVETGKASSATLKKTLIIDARRLRGSKFTETVRYILDHDEVRFKLQNITIDPEFVVPILKDMEEAKVINRIMDFSFVITNEKNAVLDEQVFIGKVLPLIGHAEKLELNCLGVSDKIVKAMSQKLPVLNSLSLFGVGVTDLTIAHLASALPKLTKIHLINSSVTSKGVQELVKKFPKLSALGLSGQNLKDDDFVVLAKAMPNLQSLSLVGQIFKNADKIKNILEVMRNLQALDLSETNASDETVKAIIATVKFLKHLDISETFITGQGVRNVAGNMDLYTLRMNSLKNIGDDELKLVARHQINLKKFYFSGVDFSNLGIMDVIQNLPGLMEISLIPSAASKWILSDSIASALVFNLPKLQYLHIQAGRLPEDVRIYLAKERPLLHIEYQP